MTSPNWCPPSTPWSSRALPLPRQHLCADAGFVGAAAKQDMLDRDYTPHVRPRHEERTQRAQGKRARRWVVEVAHSWFTRFRKLLVRYEKMHRSYLAITMLAAAIISFRHVPAKVNIIEWLAQHPNVHFHFTPTSASWLNQVEIWFGILARKTLRGASFASTEELIGAIKAFIAAYNPKAAPFVWRKREVKGSQRRNTVANLRN